MTCRRGPRSAALVYLYAGLEANATADQVLARAAAEEAPFVGNQEIEAWIVRGLTELSAPGHKPS